MFTLVIFILALVLVVLLFIMKSLEIYYGRKLFLERQFENFDAWIRKGLLKVWFWWSHINFKNSKIAFSWLINTIRQAVVVVKRRFDHKQSHFFTKRDTHITRNKSSVSFFLKNVSDYKKSLREGNEDNNNKSR